MGFRSYLFLSIFAFGSVVFGVDRTSYLCEDYDTCRANFVESVKSGAVKTTETGKWKVPSKFDDNLTIDYAFYPATKDAKNLILITSGVHGIEGFAGSAVQQYFLKEILPSLDRTHTGVLLVHAINAYGFKYLRRVSENNVDLNRNFDITKDLFSTKNDGYSKLKDILNPEKPASRSILSFAEFYYNVAKVLLRDSLKVLRQATLQGQYEYPKGLYFGGTDFEPQKEILEKPFLEIAKDYDNVLVLDVHTGYGTRGVLHLFPNVVDDKASQEATKKVFEGFKIEDASGEDFYENYGDFSMYVYRLLSKEKKLVVPMVLEFGTTNNTTTMGGVESLRRMIAENQLHHYGAASKSTASRIRKEFVEMYYPSAKWWRDAMLNETVKQLPVYVERFQKFE